MRETYGEGGVLTPHFKIKVSFDPKGHLEKKGKLIKSREQSQTGRRGTLGLLC